MSMKTIYCSLPSVLPWLYHSSGHAPWMALPRLSPSAQPCVCMHEPSGFESQDARINRKTFIINVLSIRCNKVLNSVLPVPFPAGTDLKPAVQRGLFKNGYSGWTMRRTRPHNSSTKHLFSLILRRKQGDRHSRGTNLGSSLWGSVYVTEGARACPKDIYDTHSGRFNVSPNYLLSTIM